MGGGREGRLGCTFTTLLVVCCPDFDGNTFKRCGIPP